MLIPNSTIQAALITKLKGSSAVTDLLTNGGASEVKVDQYQGSDFHYPGVRVDIVRQTPDPNFEHCDLAMLIASVRCYTEGGSSRPADILAGAVAGVLHNVLIKGGTMGTDAFFTILRASGVLGAVRLNENLWRAEITLDGHVYPSDAMGGT